MSEPDSTEAFALRRVDGRNWQILNRRYPPADSRHEVAWIGETGEDEVRVGWAASNPLPTTYRTAEDALADFVRWKQRPAGVTRPNPIPHFPPLGTR